MSLLMVGFPVSSNADDAAAPLEANYCRPIDGIVKTLAKFDSLEASKRDTVAAELTLILALDENELLPERIELRDGKTILPIVFGANNASIGFSDQLRKMSETASLCTIDPARAGRAQADRGFNTNMSMTVRFKDRSGKHSLTQLEDGLKDGRSHYKKLAGAMGFMVPKFDYISVRGADGANPPRVWATTEGADVGEPDYELYNGARLIALKTLEAMGADGVRIEDPDYRMSPSPDAKTIAKFTG
jgi:hypothetical protein